MWFKVFEDCCSGFFVEYYYQYGGFFGVGNFVDCYLVYLIDFIDYYVVQNIGDMFWVFVGQLMDYCEFFFVVDVFVQGVFGYFCMVVVQVFLDIIQGVVFVNFDCSCLQCGCVVQVFIGGDQYVVKDWMYNIQINDGQCYNDCYLMQNIGQLVEIFQW